MQLLLKDPFLLLSPVEPRDEELLCTIYSSTREKEMEMMHTWSPAQKEAFLRQQFTAQHAYYRQHYIGAFFWIIKYKGQPAGRLYIDENFVDGSLRIIDITLLPAFRNRGLGRTILEDIKVYAEKLARPVTIHVESFNPAMRLYERLGFTLKDKKNGVYYLMEWKAEAKVQPLS